MEIAAALKMGLSTVGRVRTRFVKKGLESALNERARPGQKRKLSGKQEAHHTPKHGSWLNPVLSLPKGWRR